MTELWGTYLDKNTPYDIVVLDFQLWQPPYSGYESEGARLYFQLQNNNNNNQQQ